MEKSIYEIVNPSFIFKFAGKEYTLRGADLEKAVIYQRRVKEIATNGETEYDLIAYCIYIMLKDVDPEITLDYVKMNTPATINVMEVLIQLGFLSPQQAKLVADLQMSMINQTTTDSSPSSQNEQIGPQNKSEN